MRKEGPCSDFDGVKVVELVKGFKHHLVGRRRFHNREFFNVSVKVVCM